MNLMRAASSLKKRENLGRRGTSLRVGMCLAATMRVVALVVIFTLGSSHIVMLRGQGPTSGALTGFVKNDEDGSPIPGATIEVRNKDTGDRVHTRTFADGSYALRLYPGDYIVTCRHHGFQDDTQGPFKVNLVKTTKLELPPFLLRRISKSTQAPVVPPVLLSGAQPVRRERARLEPERVLLRAPRSPWSIIPKPTARPTLSVMTRKALQPSPQLLPSHLGRQVLPPAQPARTSTLELAELKIQQRLPQALPPQAPPVMSQPVPPASPQPRPPQLPAATQMRDPQAVQMVNTANAMRGGNFDERQLSFLPMPGIRTFDNLAFLVAGVSEAPQPLSESSGPGIGAGVGTSGQFSVNGMRSRANSFTLDGSDNNDPDVAVRRQGFLSLLPQSIESVQEFQISTLLWDAELGRNLGSQVNAITKSGKNDFHGQAYGFLTDFGLNARNFFDYTGGASAGKDPLTRLQAGITLGGPVLRDRMQLFGSFEFQNINAAQEQHFASPTEGQRRFLESSSLLRVITSPKSLNRDFDYEVPGATPLGERLLSAYPIPNNARGPFGANTLTHILPASGHGEVSSLKMTYQAATNHTINARYNFTDDDRELPSIRRAISSTIDSGTRSQNLSFILDTALSDTLNNQARFSFGRTLLEFMEHKPNSPWLFQQDGITNIQPVDKMTGAPDATSTNARSSTGPIGEMIIRPFSPRGVDVFTFPQGRANNTFQYAGTLLKTWDRHSFSFGGDIRFVQFNSFQNRNYRPLIEVNNGTMDTHNLDNPSRSGPRHLPGVQFANIGQISAVSQTITAGIPNSHIGLRFREFNFFVNENWRLRPNFTVDYGLRYEYNTVPREVNERIENALRLQELPGPGRSRLDRPQFTAAFDSAVAAYRDILDDRDRMYEPDGNNFGPHVGFAWDPFKNGKTSLRGGYGVYYDTILGAVVSQSRNVFPIEVPVVTEANFFEYDGVFANNLDSFLSPAGLSPTDRIDLLKKVNGLTTNQLAGEPHDFVALIGALLNRSRAAGGLAFTLPERRLRSPYVQQWHLTLEREIFGDYFLSASYVGTKGTKLTRLTTPNGGPHVTPTQILELRGANRKVTFDRESVQYPIRRDNAFLGAYQIFENSAASNYHALQIEGRKRYSYGLTFTGAYTWSHAIDDVSDIIEAAAAPSIAQDSRSLRAERGDASYDVRHRFAASTIWDLPFFRGRNGGAAVLLGGWQFASIIQARTGLPFTLQVPFDANLDGNLTDRPESAARLIFLDGNGPRRVELAPGAQVTDFYTLNQNGFVGRNTIRADGVVNWDLALNKRFRFTESKSLDFRAEIFNVFNRANFGIPLRQIGDPGFGSSINTISPARIIQFAIKLSF
jgi:Carboxypeptidase regulatory-like domain